MRTNSKLLALALPVALVLAAASCGGDSGGGGDKNTVRMLSHFSQADPKEKALTEVIAEFEKANPDVNVEVEAGPSPEETHDRYERAKLAGNEPDLVFTNLFGKTTSWLDNGATVDVAKYAKEWGLESRLLPEALKGWQTSDGELQGFPYEGFTWPVWYNLDLFEKAGVEKVPATTDDLIAATKKLRAAGIQPFATGGKDWSGNKLFSLVVETMVTDEQAIAAFRDGKWDTPEVRAGIETFVELRDAGAFTDNAEGLTVDQQRSSFGAGKAAMMHQGSWDYGSPDVPAAETANIELGGFPLPPDSARAKPIVYTDYTATGLWLSPNGEEKIDAVEKLVTFMYTPEALGRFAQAGVHAPVPIDKVDVDQSKLPKLAVQASEELAGKTERAVLQDIYIPAESQTGFERATSLAYSPETSVDEIIAALKQAWQ